MKKTIIIGVIFMLVLFSGCDPQNAKGNIDSQANIIFEAIRTKNSDLLKSVLSQNALNSLLIFSLMLSQVKTLTL